MRFSNTVLVSITMALVHAYPLKHDNIGLDADLAYNKPAAVARAEVDADLAYNKPAAVAK
ncbi:hypothetical protein LX32DRAFT_728896 [Colletotrichum zoysiae]|uniref:Uncharacterized protein n=1 Tax=Colletotrichum zoysiae TaxID=1216348 RepID=A0AAD9HH90_9PEZI|nr:hypothetical protein LX32DRAFT_728896 [Colletotrichum zoysiae]